MKRLALLAGMIVVLVSLPLKAQVTIGSTEPPQSYSLLELVSQNRGLRLPQITFGEGAGEVNRDSFTEMLTNAGNNAKGLQIFNMNTRCVETWNGDVWLSACGEDLLCNNIPLPEFAHYNVHYNDAGGTPASPTFNSPKAMMEALAAENPDFSTIYGDYYEWDSNWSNNKTINEDTDCGVLYEMLRYQNPTPCSICPDGYRLPTQDEWERIAPYDCNASFAVGNTNISNQTTGTAPHEILMLFGWRLIVLMGCAWHKAAIIGLILTTTICAMVMRFIIRTNGWLSTTKQAICLTVAHPNLFSSCLPLVIKQAMSYAVKEFTDFTGAVH